MTRVRSLRRDLTLGVAAGLTIFWALAMTASVLIVREQFLDEVYDNLMEETAARLLPMQIQPDTTPIVPQSEVLLTWVLRGNGGAILQQSGGADPETFEAIAPEGFSTIGNQRHFVRSDADHSIDVASPLDERREATWGVFSALLVPMLILLPLTLIGVLWFMKARLRPVAALSAEVAGRHPEDLRPLATQGLQSELLPVRDEVNRLMKSLRDALDAERAFSGDAAHELRTPIASTLAHVQRLIAEAPDGPIAERAHAVEAELKRITRLVEKLLQLSRAENLEIMAATPSDIAPILALVASDFDVPCELPDGPVNSRLDPDVVAILARNLIENAVTHGHDARVSLSADGCLRVTNRGRIVPAANLPTLTRRFDRGEARSPGSGLGLAIVASIARNSGSEFGFASPAKGQPDGFEAWIFL